MKRGGFKSVPLYGFDRLLIEPHAKRTNDMDVLRVSILIHYQTHKSRALESRFVCLFAEFWFW